MTILVSDVMTKNVRSVSTETTLLELERLLIETGLGGAPVTQAGELVGVVSRTDIVRRLLAGQDLRQYVLEQTHQAISGFDVPLRELWPVGLRSLNTDLEAELLRLRVADIMSPRPITVASDAPIEAAGRLMVERHVHRLIVVEHKHLAGILSSLDLVRFYCGPVS